MAAEGGDDLVLVCPAGPHDLGPLDLGGVAFVARSVTQHVAGSEACEVTRRRDGLPVVGASRQPGVGTLHLLASPVLIDEQVKPDEGEPYRDGLGRRIGMLRGVCIDHRLMQEVQAGPLGVVGREFEVCGVAGH